jgi:hypothetical protein
LRMLLSTLEPRNFVFWLPFCLSHASSVSQPFCSWPFNEMQLCNRCQCTEACQIVNNRFFMLYYQLGFIIGCPFWVTWMLCTSVLGSGTYWYLYSVLWFNKLIDAT